MVGRMYHFEPNPSRLTRNVLQCLLCEDVIESKHRNDFQSCSCGNVFVDGGLDYCRVGVRELNGPEPTMRSLCEYEDKGEDMTVSM